MELFHTCGKSEFSFKENHSFSTAESHNKKTKCKHDNKICPTYYKKCMEKSKICQQLIQNNKKNTHFPKCTPESHSMRHFEIIDQEEERIKFVFNKDYLTLDAFGFGMANCCIQITYSSRNITEARSVYDQFSVISSFMAAFSASTAVIDGTLIDWDVRSRIIEQSTDSRNKSENVG